MPVIGEKLSSLEAVKFLEISNKDDLNPSGGLKNKPLSEVNNQTLPKLLDKDSSPARAAETTTNVQK